jgi:uncharacterized protein YbaR (Trm112 family)
LRGWPFGIESVKATERDIMAISPELLEILRCPQCRSKVEIDAEETRLKCVNPECSLVYPIRDEIPVMLVEEATVEK